MKTLLPVFVIAALIGTTVRVVASTPEPPGTELWAYQASASAATIGQYDFGTATFQSSCVPDSTANGRGIALATDGNLWYTRLGAGFTGDGLIHKASPPPACTAITTIPSPQADIGELDTDPADGNLWAAGYSPCDTTGTTCGFFTAGATEQFLYKVSASNGALLASCHIPKQTSGGNDTLAVATYNGVKVLLTDATEADSTSLFAVDAASCVGGAAGTIVATFTMPNGVRGIDFDFTTGNLIGTSADGNSIINYGPLQPVMVPTGQTMAAAPVNGNIEGITLSVQGSAPPPPLNGKATGGGMVSPALGSTTANFGFNARVSSGVASGNLEYNPKGGTALHCKVTAVTSFATTGSTQSTGPKGGGSMDFTVSCNNNTSTHQVHVEDNAEPGAGSDKFTIDGVGGTITRGNIQIHATQ